MKKVAPPSIRRMLVKLGVLFLVPVVLFAGCFVLDSLSISKARPPDSVQTLQDFLAWKKEGIQGKGTFESAGATYTVILGQPARSFASGPAAYLFDTNGQFVDWTADMGDFRTVRHRFDLTSGHVKSITREKP